MKLPFRFFPVVFGATALLVGGAGADGIDYPSQVRPILEGHCFKCHGEEKQKGKFRLDTLSPEMMEDRRAAEHWHDVRDALNLGEMPPDDEPELSPKDRQVLVTWITREIDALLEARRSTGGRTVLRRLTRDEYQNTMRDLLGVDLDYARNLPPESLSPDGFTNEGATLQMTDMQLDYYLQAAREGLRKAIVTGPEPEVFSHTFTKSVGQSKKGGQVGNILDGSREFIGKMMEYPEEGEFLIRVKAKAGLVEGQGYPRLRVALGHRADTKGPRGYMPPLDVTGEDWQTLEFRGRVEDFPLPSGTQSKFPGLLVTLDNGENRSGGRKKPKGKKNRGDGNDAAKPRSAPFVEVGSVEFLAPVFDQWPPSRHSAILFSSDTRETDEAGYADEVIERFMERAFRRPVSAGEMAAFQEFHAAARSRSDSFEDAIRETLAMVLIAPQFLYLVEPAQDVKRPISDWELASRLSYFLWRTMPDQQLRDLAAAGTLSEPALLAGEVRRMLADERSWQLTEGFGGQWLDVGAVERVAVNPEFYPKFDNALKASMRGETLHFFHEILAKDLSALNFLDSDFTMLDRALARHYGLEGPRGSRFERVSLDPADERGGVLTHGSMLLGNSTGSDSHPVKRAVWIRARLLDDPPADPPPNVPNLDSSNPDFARLPVIEQLRLHRQEASCNDCHRGIDPWGIAMENFGGDGLWREKIGRRPAVTATKLPDGTEIADLRDLKAYLLKDRREQFAEALAAKMFAYALGRRLEFTDQKAVDELAEGFERNDYRISPLIQLIVSSEEFQSK